MQFQVDSFNHYDPFPGYRSLFVERLIVSPIISGVCLTLSTERFVPYAFDFGYGHSWIRLRCSQRVCMKPFLGLPVVYP